MALQAGSINVSATVWDFFDLATSGSYLCFSLESCPFLRVFTQANKIICILDLKQKKCFVQRWRLTLFGTRALLAPYSFSPQTKHNGAVASPTVKVNTLPGDFAQAHRLYFLLPSTHTTCLPLGPNFVQGSVRS